MTMFEIEKRLAVRSVRLKVGHKQVFVAGLMGPTHHRIMRVLVKNNSQSEFELTSYPEKGTGGQY